MTPNNEMLVYASRHKDFFELLQRTSMNLPDSTGLLFAAHDTDQHLPERVTGVDTVTELCSKLEPNNPVFLLGAKEGVAKTAALNLKKKFPNLYIAGTESGSPSEKESQALVQKINASKARVLFVAFGAPAQDEWIAKHFKDFQYVRLAMGVGGTFDFLAGTVKRAPVWMQKHGLEWLWRLAMDPRRIGRIWRATVTFPRLIKRYGKTSPL